MTDRGSSSPRRRAIVMAANPVAPYSRATRVARSLAVAGWDVEVAAKAAPSLALEEHDGEVLVRRFADSGPWVEKLARRPGPPGLGRRVVMRIHRVIASRSTWARSHPPPTIADVRNKLFWPTQDRPWWHSLERDLGPADLYHACGYRTLPVALRLAETARRRGRSGSVVYDAIDIAIESNTFITRHPFWRRIYQHRERLWARRADAVVTANDALADDLVGRLGLSARPVVLPNVPPRWTPPVAPLDLIRRATGVPADYRIVLYLGRLARYRGLQIARDAVRQVERAALVLVGFGSLEPEMRRLDDEPDLRGIHFTLPPVHPDEVPAWASSADVSFVALPPVSLNQRLSTPNKFWESLAGGTPVVVARDALVMRAIVERHGIGAVADATDPADVAKAITSIVDAPEADRRAMRERALAIARERYCWEEVVGRYLDLARQLVATGRDRAG